MESLLKEVLAGIKPDTKPAEVKYFLDKINKEISRKKIKAKAVLGGSFAKDTFLKQDHDVDIFAAFDMKYKDKDLSGLLEAVLKKFKPIRIHGSRDYFQIKDGINYEIVPVLAIKKPAQARNVTDFSPRHVAWTNKNGKNLKDDILLAKKFCKAQKVYGAESYIKGFSGHVIDILVINYKGFVPFLKAAGKWKDKQVIDWKNYYKGKALKEMNLSKLQSPLIVVDPLQRERNASAALSFEKFDMLRKAARSFIKKHSKTFFVEKKIDVSKLKGNVAAVEVMPKTGKPDTVGGKLLKVFEFFKKNLSEFEVLKSGWEWNKKEKALMWFTLKERKLSAKKIWEGPPLHRKEHVARFKKKYKKNFIKGKRICAEVKREHTKPEELLEDLFKQKYVRERVKKCRMKS